MERSVILLVEDEPDLLQILATAVAWALPAYRVVGAATLDEANDCLADLEATRTPLALAMVDHVLGGTSRQGAEDEVATGLGLIEAVHRRFPSTVTFLFTGQATPKVEERARATGTRVLWKPLRLKALLGEVAAALG